MSNTYEDLKAAFSGEAEAALKYLAFAKKADQDGYPQVARLFRAASAAEHVHAHAHLRVMDGIKGIIENLNEGINGEHYESHSMYPGFIKTAEAEENKKAVRSFYNAMTVEMEHEGYYREALELVEKDAQMEEYDYYICPVCGHTHARTAPDKCPICGAPGSTFERVH